MGHNVAKIKEITDNELMQMFICDDDQIAFERLYHKHKAALLRFSFGYTGSQALAEEVVHETFLKVYRFKTKYDSKQAFKTWLWTICKNTNLDSLDKRKLGLEESLDDLIFEIESPIDSALEQLITASTQEKIQADLLTIPLSQREALLLWMNDDLSFEEMGNVLNKSPQAVKNLIHRAKLTLKEKLGGSL